MMDRKTLTMVTDPKRRRMADRDNRGSPAPPRDLFGQIVRIVLAIYLAPVFLAVVVVGAIGMVCGALVRGAERLTSGLSARTRL